MTTPPTDARDGAQVPQEDAMTRALDKEINDAEEVRDDPRNGLESLAYWRGRVHGLTRAKQLIAVNDDRERGEDGR